MPINRVPYPNALPTEQNDYVKQNDLLETGFLRVNDPVSFDVGLGVVLQGAVFQCGGTVYRCDGDTAIGGAASQYVRLAPSGGGATLTPTYVANLAGVSWNKAYNGYYDGGGNLYVFDEGRAMIQGEIAAVVGRYVMQARTGDAYVGRDLVAGRNVVVGGPTGGALGFDAVKGALQAKHDFMPAAGLATSGSVIIAGTGGTWVPPRGWYWMAADNSGSSRFQIFVGGSWRYAGPTTDEAHQGFGYFDGSNMRLINGNALASTVYWIRIF